MEIVPFNSETRVPPFPFGLEAIPLLLAFAVIFGVRHENQGLEKENVEMKEALRMMHQHIHTIESDKKLLEETIEHLESKLPEEDNIEQVESKLPEEETDSIVLEGVLLNILHKRRGKTVREVLTEVKKTYANFDKHMVNSVLYRLMRLNRVIYKKKKSEMQPIWFAVN